MICFWYFIQIYLAKQQRLWYQIFFEVHTLKNSYKNESLSYLLVSFRFIVAQRYKKRPLHLAKNCTVKRYLICPLFKVD